MMVYVHFPTTQKAEVGESYIHHQLDLHLETQSEKKSKFLSQENIVLVQQDSASWATLSWHPHGLTSARNWVDPQENLINAPRLRVANPECTMVERIAETRTKGCQSVCYLLGGGG